MYSVNEMCKSQSCTSYFIREFFCFVFCFKPTPYTPPACEWFHNHHHHHHGSNSNSFFSPYQSIYLFHLGYYVHIFFLNILHSQSIIYCETTKFKQREKKTKMQ